MAATIIDTLKIVMGMDAKGVEQGMQKVQGTLQNGLSSIMTNFVAPLFGALSAGKLFADYTSKADAIGKMSAALNVDGEALQAWGEAAARAGGSAEGFNSSVSSLNKGLQMFVSTGSGRLKEPLEALGLSKSALTDAQGNAKDVFEIMQTLADKAETMDKAKFAGIAERLGIDQGTVMLLQSGRRAVDDLVARQKSLGVYTKRDFEVTAAFNDAIADLGQVFRSVAAIVMRVVTPVLTAVAGVLTDVMMFLRRHEPFVLAFFGGIAAIVTARLLPALYKMIAAGVRFMLTPFGAMIAVIAGLALVFDDLVAYMQGGESMLSDFWGLFGTGEEIAAALSNAFETVKAVVTNVISVIRSALTRLIAWATPYIKAAFAQIISAIRGVMAFWARIQPHVEKIFNAIVSIIRSAIKIVVSIVSALVDAIMAIWGAIGPYVETLFGFLVEVIAGAIDIMATIIEKIAAVVGYVAENISTIWQGICDTMRSAWDNTIGWMIDKFAGFIDGVKGAWNTVKGWFGFGDDDAQSAAVMIPSATMRGAPNGSFDGAYLPTGTSAEQSIAPANVNNRTNIDNDTTVNANITVQTQATDAQGIAQGIGNAVENDFKSRDLVNIGNGGVIK